MQDIDQNEYKSLKWMLDNCITGILDETFSYENERFGVKEVVDLKENGRNIIVTEENKKEYVNLKCINRMATSI